MPYDAAAIKRQLGTKIGPLPAVAWAGIAGGGYVVYRYIKAARAAPTTPLTEPNGIDPANADIGGYDVNATDTTGDYSNASGGFYANGGLSSTAVTGSSSAATTNTDWGLRAVNDAIAHGANPLDASVAIGSYLYGSDTPLNATQTAILTDVLRRLGPPPEGVISPPTTTPIPVPVVPTPKKFPPGTSGPAPFVSHKPTNPNPTNPTAPGSGYTQSTPGGINSVTGQPYKPGGHWVQGPAGWGYIEPGTVLKR